MKAFTGKNSFTGDLNTYHIHVDPDNDQKLGLDLSLHRTAPSFRAATGVGAGSKFFGWFNPVPRGVVAGTISITPQPKQVVGVGYHDHNWGNVSRGELLDTWWWGRGNDGENTVCHLPQQNGAHQPASLRLSQLPKLQTSGKGVMFLEISWGSGLAPVVGGEPLAPLLAWCWM